MVDVNDLDKRLKAVEKRNQRVEMDKKWEGSVTRRLLIAALTYLVVLAYLTMRNDTNAMLDAVVPVIGYTLSTVILKAVKESWIKRFW